MLLITEYGKEIEVADNLIAELPNGNVIVFKVMEDRPLIINDFYSIQKR